MTYPIEKGIPMPQKTCERTRRYPIKEMQAGDSFLIPSKELGKHASQAVRNSAAYYGKKVSTRTVKGGLRVWVVSVSKKGSQP